MLPSLSALRSPRSRLITVEVPDPLSSLLDFVLDSSFSSLFNLILKIVFVFCFFYASTFTAFVVLYIDLRQPNIVCRACRVQCAAICEWFKANSTSIQLMEDMEDYFTRPIEFSDHTIKTRRKSFSKQSALSFVASESMFSRIRRCPNSVTPLRKYNV